MKCEAVGAAIRFRDFELGDLGEWGLFHGQFGRIRWLSGFRHRFRNAGFRDPVEEVFRRCLKPARHVQVERGSQSVAVAEAVRSVDVCLALDSVHRSGGTVRQQRKKRIQILFETPLPEIVRVLRKPGEPFRSLRIQRLESRR